MFQQLIARIKTSPRATQLRRHNNKQYVFPVAAVQTAQVSRRRIIPNRSRNDIITFRVFPSSDAVFFHNIFHITHVTSKVVCVKNNVLFCFFNSFRAQLVHVSFINTGKSFILNSEKSERVSLIRDVEKLLKNIKVIRTHAQTQTHLSNDPFQLIHFIHLRHNFKTFNRSLFSFFHPLPLVRWTSETPQTND